MVQSQYQQVEAEKNKYYGKSIELEKEISRLSLALD